MYKIKGTDIYLTRGDTLIVQLNILKDGEVYVPVSTDVIRFALKRSILRADKAEYLDEESLVEKVIPTDTLILRVESEDTKNLPFGTYDYDIQITMGDNIVDTFLAGKLYLEKEVA